MNGYNNSFSNIFYFRTENSAGFQRFLMRAGQVEKPVGNLKHSRDMVLYIRTEVFPITSIKIYLDEKGNLTMKIEDIIYN